MRLLLQKQSDLGLPCLFRPFWQATSVRNFRTFFMLKDDGNRPLGLSRGLD